MAKILIIAGILLLATGLVLYYFPNLLKWVGRLPGDFYVQQNKVSFYFPLTTSILVSILLSLLFYFLKK